MGRLWMVGRRMPFRRQLTARHRRVAISVNIGSRPTRPNRIYPITLQSDLPACLSGALVNSLKLLNVINCKDLERVLSLLKGASSFIRFEEAVVPTREVLECDYGRAIGTCLGVAVQDRANQL